MIHHFVSGSASLALPAAKIAPSIPALRVATFDDYAQIAHLETTHGIVPEPFQDWKSLWTNNPLWWANRGDWPLGWVLESEDRRIVGALMNVGSAYVFQGRSIRCATGRASVVAPPYREYSPWLMEEYLSQPHADLCIATNVDSTLMPTWSRLGQKIPLGDWQDVAYWVTSHRAFAQRALQSKEVPLARPLSRSLAALLKVWARCLPALPSAPHGVTIQSTDRFDNRFNALWDELVQQNPGKLLAVRNRAALEWHFAAPLRRRDLWIFTASRGGLLRAYCILKRNRQADGMRRMQLVDFQSVDQRDDLLPGLLREALQQCQRRQIDLLEHQGLGIPKMRAFDLHAPHHRRLGNWPCFYRAADSDMHETLRSPQTWDASAFDGNSSFE